MLNIPADLPDLKSPTKDFLFYPFSMDHSDELGAIIGTESTWIQGYLDGAKTPANAGDAKALIAVWMLPNPTFSILTNDENRRVIGAINVVETNQNQSFARLGNMIIHPDFWSIDIRLEIVGTVLDFLFEHGAARVEAREAKSNMPAIEVLRRAGFVDEGVRRNSVQQHDGTWADRMVMSIVPQDWVARREGLYKLVESKRGR